MDNNGLQCTLNSRDIFQKLEILFGKLHFSNKDIIATKEINSLLSYLSHVIFCKKKKNVMNLSPGLEQCINFKALSLSFKCPKTTHRTPCFVLDINRYLLTYSLCFLLC